LGGFYAKNGSCSLLKLQKVPGLRFGSGAATSGAGAGAPAAPALATAEPAHYALKKFVN